MQESRAKSWTLRYQLNGKRREMGLGSLDDVPAPLAREKAAEARALLRRGISPLVARDNASARALPRWWPRPRPVRSPSMMSPPSTSRVTALAGPNAKHVGQWETTLDKYASPVIGDKPVGAVTTDDVLRIRWPIWVTKTETASRVRSRIEQPGAVLRQSKGLRQGENPAILARSWTRSCRSLAR